MEYVWFNDGINDQVVSFDLILQNAVKDSLTLRARSFVWPKSQMDWRLGGKVREERVCLFTSKLTVRSTV